MKRDDAEMAPDDDDAVPEETAPKGARSGTQSIERAVTMLRVIASRGRRGMRIAEVASTAGLAQSTCFRMLKSMQSEGLVDKDGHTRKYYLGSLVYELGLLARPRYRLSELCDNAMQALAESTQETVYLSERSGLEAVCTARTLGDYPIKALPLDVGIRRPLGVGAGGLAILGAMDAEEAAAIVATNAGRYEAYGGLTAADLLVAIDETRQRGWSFLDSVATPGTAALGVALPSQGPLAAISVAAITSRLPPERRGEIAGLLKRQTDKISAVLRELRGVGPA
ncbi:MAG: IclR family regulatory protein [Rhizobacter sp.]|nr:IclR family regulatory protein [Rhizobacter sp.]